MKALLLTDTYPTEGNPNAGIFLKRRVDAIRAHGVDIEIGVPKFIFENRRFAPFRKDEFAREGISGIRYRFKVPHTGLTSLPAQLVAFARERKVDVIAVHFGWNAPAAFKARLKGGPPYIAYCHGSDVHTIPFQDEGYRRRLIPALEGAAAAIFVSSALLETARGLGYSGNNALVIPNGYDPEVFHPGPAEDAGESVVFAGNLRPVKRPLLLPAVFRRIKELRPGANFLIAGEGPLEAELHEALSEAKLAGCSRIMGALPQSALAGAFRSARVLMLPSANEGWPCVVKEAQACGLAVVGSDNGGIREAIGSGGRAVEDGPDATEELAQAAASFLDGSGRGAALEAARGYSWSATTEREIAALQGAAADLTRSPRPSKHCGMRNRS